ncbi:MAG: hypothetical protein DDT30_00824 [Dehalococcoidia bacterium]|nr:hypothetical protein [Bacillota bacterium]
MLFKVGLAVYDEPGIVIDKYDKIGHLFLARCSGWGLFLLEGYGFFQHIGGNLFALQFVGPHRREQCTLWALPTPALAGGNPPCLA